MKVLLTAFVILALVVPAFAAGPAGSETAIRQVWQQFSDAWGRGDAHARAALWAEDASLINPYGIVAEGRPAIEKLFEQEVAGFAKGTTNTFSNFTYHFLTPTLATVDATGEIKGIQSAEGSPLPTVTVHVFAVMSEKGGKWQIKAARPSVPAPMPGPHPTGAM